MAPVTLLRPFGPSATLFALAADALVRGDVSGAALLTRQADLALQFELKCSLTWAATDAILRKAKADG